MRGFLVKWELRKVPREFTTARLVIIMSTFADYGNGILSYCERHPVVTSANAAVGGRREISVICMICESVFFMREDGNFYSANLKRFVWGSNEIILSIKKGLRRSFRAKLYWTRSFASYSTPHSHFPAVSSAKSQNISELQFCNF